MSAPNESGCDRYGVVNVESTTSGTPTLCAASATLSSSTMTHAGLETDSQKKARVLSSAALTKLAGSVSSTKRTVMPMVGRMSLNIV